MDGIKKKPQVTCSSYNSETIFRASSKMSGPFSLVIWPRKIKQSSDEHFLEPEELQGLAYTLVDNAHSCNPVYSDLLYAV
jgi:hypothetical protein